MFFDVVKKDIKDIRENLLFHGRISFSEQGAALSWSASGFTLRFEGRIAVFDFAPFSSDNPVIIRVKADSQKSKYSVSNGKENIIIDFEEQGIHEIELLRISFSTDPIYIKSVALYGEKVSLLKAEKQYSLKMEFLGDSITCGYGVFGTENCYRAFEEDATKTYAYLTAERFGAQARYLGWSGKGIYCSCGGERINTFANYFTRDIPSNENNTWDFSCWQPDILVINGGTNDCGGSATKEQFKNSARELYRLARKVYPNAKIIFVLGAMGNAYHNELCELEDELKAKDSKVYYKAVESIYKNRSTEVGGNGHPSFLGQKRVADELISFIEKII